MAAIRRYLRDADRSIDNYEKVVALIALRHNDGSVVKGDCLQSVGNCQPLPLVQVLQDGNLQRVTLKNH